jgi:hypothetical protein
MLCQYSNLRCCWKYCCFLIESYTYVLALKAPYPLPPNYSDADDMCGYFAFDFINTTNKCLLFHYYWAGIVPFYNSSFQIFLLGEDNVLELIKEVVAPLGTFQTYNYPHGLESAASGPAIETRTS